MRPQNVVALLVGDPHAPDLWTLKNLASVAGRLTVVSAESGSGVSARKRLRGLIREHGVIRVASRVLAGKLIGKLQEHRELEELERLFDGEHLRDWWAHCGISPIRVPHLNHENARLVIAALEPDIIVRVSGGILKREIFGLACTAALNIHHGVAPRIRGMWSIPWGIVEGRTDWIGATVHLIDDGIDTARPAGVEDLPVRRELYEPGLLGGAALSSLAPREVDTEVRASSRGGGRHGFTVAALWLPLTPAPSMTIEAWPDRD